MCKHMLCVIVIITFVFSLLYFARLQKYNAQNFIRAPFNSSRQTNTTQKPKNFAERAIFVSFFRRNYVKSLKLQNALLRDIPLPDFFPAVS